MAVGQQLLYHRRVTSPITVVSLSSVPAGSVLWRTHTGTWICTVVCKATFTLRPGEATLAAQMEPLQATERLYPDGASGGTHAPADLVPLKPRVDIVLVGNAFAPGQQPASSVVARLAIGEVDKRIEVHQDRHFDLEGTLHEGPRFTKAPLGYERAAIGSQGQNPIGVRTDARDRYGCLPVPNLQAMGRLVASPSDVFFEPISFGPIAAGWSPRRELAAAVGTLPAEWQGQTIPKVLDLAYFNVAPRDQQLPALRGDERFLLENLHSEHPRLATSLPRIAPRTFARGLSGVPRPVAMRADTLWIDTARGICTLTWRGQMPLQGTQESLLVLLALEAVDHPLTWENLEQMHRATTTAPMPPLALFETTTVVSLADPAIVKLALPFATAVAPAPNARWAPIGGGLPFRPSEGAPPPERAAAPPPGPIGPPMLDFERPLEVAAIDAVRPALAAHAAVESPWGRSAPPIEVRETAIFREPLSQVAAPRARATPSDAATRAASQDPLLLVWFDAAALPRLRKTASFRAVLDALDNHSLDEVLDDPELADDAAEVEDRSEAFEVLARGSVVGREGMLSALTDATRADGRTAQPLVLAAGELQLVFDELEELRATVTAAASHAGDDLLAKGILDLAKEFLATPGLPGAPPVAEGLSARIRDTFEKRGLLPAGYLAAQAEHAVLAGHHHQKRAVFGAVHARALFVSGPADRSPIPSYLGEALAAKLPAARRLRVRMLVEVHHALDQHETHPIALRPVALALVTASMRRAP
jgi:hypothetical protein